MLVESILRRFLVASMAGKRNLVPLFVLLSLSFVFLVTLYRSPLVLPSSSSSTVSPVFAGPIHGSKTSSSIFSLTLKLLTFDRLASLSRCLRSLADADYGDDRVNLHIFVDHFKIPDPTDKEFANVEIKLNESLTILRFIYEFPWKYGEKLVHYRTANVGLQAQWLEAWWPSSDNEFVFVVEDDLEVSKLYYHYLKKLILFYYYNSSNYNPSVFGATLQRPRFVPGNPSSSSSSSSIS